MEGEPYTARAHFESALTHYPDHPTAIVGLSNILLDIYAEEILPPPSVPKIALSDGESIIVGAGSEDQQFSRAKAKIPALPSEPLGLASGEVKSDIIARSPFSPQLPAIKAVTSDELPAPYKAVSLPLIDRLAARDRAYGLLSGLTKLGVGWNHSDAWFALARAHEESGQVDKAKEALWWCVELEEGLGVREWNCVGTGGYVL